MASRSLSFPDDVRPDFTGFSQAGLDFLRGLAANNDRTWFRAHQEVYETEVRFAMECLLAEFSPDRRPAGIPVRGDPARGMFRIHRDVRFAADKSPYKTHAGAVLSRSGARGDPGIVYIHIQPGASFVSAGFYALDRDFLTAWRRRMTEVPDRFLDIAKPFVSGRGPYTLRHRGALRTLPRGFAEHADSPVAEYLKWKHFLVSRPVTDRQASRRDLIRIVAETATAAAPLLDFGWEIYETAFEDDPRRHMRTRG